MKHKPKPRVSHARTMLTRSVQFEELGSIPDAPGYHIANDGRVWSEKRRGSSGRWVAQQIHPRSNLRRVSLRIDGQAKNFFVHRLVLLTFVGPAPEDKPLCRHLDGDPSNNHVENLCWGTHTENMQDREEHGRNDLVRGETNPNAKLKGVQVDSIRERLLNGERRSVLANEFGVTKTTIAAIANNRSWKCRLNS